MSRNSALCGAFFLALFSVFFFSGVAQAENVKLKFSDGSEIEGEILKLDEKIGFEIKLKDSGLKLKFRWNRLSPDDVSAIKALLLERKKNPEKPVKPVKPEKPEKPVKPVKKTAPESPGGNINPEVKPPKPYSLEVVDALKVIFDTGKIAYGIEDRDDGDIRTLVLKERGRVGYYYRVRIKKSQKIKVDPDMIYDGDKLYELAIKKFAPKTATEHYRMGLFCLGIANHTRARQHFETSLELGGKLTSLAEDMLEKLDDLMVREAEASRLFQELLVTEAQDMFDPALDILKKISSEFADTMVCKRLPPIKERIEKKKAEFAKIK